MRSLVKKIDNHEPVLSYLKSEKLSWKYLAETLFASVVLKDKEKENEVKLRFGMLWSRFADDFLNEEFTHEYNSIKHGLRLHLGGSYLAFRLEETPGRPAPDAKREVIAQSRFGSHFVTNEKIGEYPQHISLTNHSQNWNPENFAWGLKLMSLSILNIQSSLKVLNGVEADQVQFTWPSDLSEFDEPWKLSQTDRRSSFIITPVKIHPEFIDKLSKEEILENYKTGKVMGTRRLTFKNSPTISGGQTGEGETGT